MRPPVSVPTLSRRAKLLLGAVGVLLVLFTAIGTLTNVYVDYLWFDETGFTEVFWTELQTRALLFAVAGVATGEEQRAGLQLGPEDLGEAGLVEPQVVDVDVGQRPDRGEQHEQDTHGAQQQLRPPRQRRHGHGGPHGHEGSPSCCTFERGADRTGPALPAIPAQRTGAAGVPASRRSAGLGGAPGLEVVERLEGVVERRHPGQREAGVVDPQRLGAVVGRDQEEFGADVAGGDHLQRDAAARAD